MTDSNKDKKIKEKLTEEEKLSPLYFFYSVGCGWCKRIMPIVDELIGEGHDILKLDLADKENQEVQKEVKEKYNLKCGTPWLVNADTGHQICGFREKDIILKWINGENIPTPPKPTGPPPRPPLMNASDKEVNEWKKEYDEWADKNSHLPNIRSVDEILDMPRPKSLPPNPPKPDSTDDELNRWKVEYEKWVKVNSHLPNLIPADTIIQRFKNRGQPQDVGPVSNIVGGNVQHQKNLNLKYYYVVENGQKIEVYADSEYVKSLKQQYYVRNNSGKLIKVVDDIEWENKRSKQSQVKSKTSQRSVPAPPASKKPPKKKRNKKK